MTCVDVRNTAEESFINNFQSNMNHQAPWCLFSGSQALQFVSLSANKLSPLRVYQQPAVSLQWTSLPDNSTMSHKCITAKKNTVYVVIILLLSLLSHLCVPNVICETTGPLCIFPESSCWHGSMQSSVTACHIWQQQTCKSGSRSCGKDTVLKNHRSLFTVLFWTYYWTKFPWTASASADCSV